MFNSYVYAGGRVWGGLLRGRKDRRSAPTTRRPCTDAVVTAGMCVCVRQPGMWLCPSVLSRRDNKFESIVLRTMDVVLPGLRVRSAATMSFPPKSWSFSGFSTTSLAGRFGMRPRGRAPFPGAGRVLLSNELEEWHGVLA